MIELAKKMNIKIVEKDLTLYDAYNAEEAFWTGSEICKRRREIRWMLLKSHKLG